MAANARASPAVWEKPISISANAATATGTDVVQHQRRVRDGERRQPARYVPHERDAVVAEVEDVRREQSPDDEHEGTRHVRRDDP